MNKNVKKIVSMALVLGTVSAVAPSTSINLLTTKAYAADNEDTTLDSLKLEDSSGSTIKLYSDSDYDSDSKLDKDDTPEEDTYYAKTSSSTIKIDTDGPKSKYIKVFKGTSDNTKGKSITSDISISSDTTLTIRVYDGEPGSSVEYDDDNDDANKESEYKIKIKYTGSDSSDSSDSYDDIYLDKLSVEGESISLSKSKTDYTYNVASDVDEVTIKAVPEDTDYTITIAGNEVNEDDDKYKDDVSLDKGENKIKIKVEDDNEERVYTLNITRGSSSSTSTSTTKTETAAAATATATTTPSTATNVVTTTAKASKWLQVNGKWQYNDSTGNPAKNMWVQNYYLQADGNMATDWQTIGGYWYYLGSDGAKKTGWQSAGGTWYYLDGEGRMQTGWMKDLNNGKYYFLNSNGSMASNTTIGVYKLGTDGAWINK